LDLKTFVFVDSTLTRKDIRGYTNLNFCGPAKRGSFYGLGSSKKRIVLIDGVILYERSVWQREILYQISIGSEVYGCSSIGAIRASELDVYGMKGHGWIYSQFKSGAITADDEACLLYEISEGTIRKKTLPLVEIRWALHCLNINEDRELYRSTIADLSRISFYDRTAERVVRILRQRCGERLDHTFYENLITGRYDIKRLDAVSLLERINSSYI